MQKTRVMKMLKTLKIKKPPIKLPIKPKKAKIRLMLTPPKRPRKAARKARRKLKKRPRRLPRRRKLPVIKYKMLRIKP